MRLQPITALTFLASTLLLVGVNATHPGLDVPGRAWIALASHLTLSLLAAAALWPRSRWLGTGFLLWALSALAWRLGNLTGTKLPGLPAELLMAAGLLLILAGTVHALRKELKRQWPLALAVALPMLALAQYAFIARLPFGMGTTFGLLAGFLAAVALFGLATGSGSTLHAGLFMLAAGHFALLWTAIHGTYYISSWVDILLAIGLFFAAASDRKERPAERKFE
jgi:hypothetical protein